MQGSWPGGIPGLAPGGSWYGLRRSQSQQRALVLAQPAFAIQAAAETGELAARPDHAVAGHDDGDGILAVGGADCAGRVLVAEVACMCAGTGRGAIGD